MVAPTNCSSPAPPVCLLTVESTEAGKCAKCADHLTTIQNLEIQLTEEKQQKDNLAECLNNTFAALTKEFENNELKDTKILQLSEQLHESTNQLTAISKVESTKSLKKTMDKFQKEIMADKEALQLELKKVSGVERGPGTSNQHLDTDLGDQMEAAVEENWALKSALDAANQMILHLEYKLQAAAQRLEVISNDITPEDHAASKDNSKLPGSEEEPAGQPESPESPVTSTDQLPMKHPDEKNSTATNEHGNLQTKFKELSAQLHEAQRAHTLIKKARGNANRILDEKFHHSQQQLNFFSHQSKQLVKEVEYVRRQLHNAEQERAYLRNHLEYTLKEKEHLGILLADANRQAVDNREADKLKDMLVEQREWSGELREENARLEDEIEEKDEEIQKLLEKEEKFAAKNEKLVNKNLQLQKLVQELHGFPGSLENNSLLLDDSTSEPTTPTTPNTPRTPISSQSPASPTDGKSPIIQRKRRSDEHENGENKKQKQ